MASNVDNEGNDLSEQVEHIVDEVYYKVRLLTSVWPVQDDILNEHLLHLSERLSYDLLRTAAFRGLDSSGNLDPWASRPGFSFANVPQTEYSGVDQSIISQMLSGDTEGDEIYSFESILGTEEAEQSQPRTSRKRKRGALDRTDILSKFDWTAKVKVQELLKDIPNGYLETALYLVTATGRVDIFKQLQMLCETFCDPDSSLKRFRDCRGYRAVNQLYDDLEKSARGLRVKRRLCLVQLYQSYCDEIKAIDPNAVSERIRSCRATSEVQKQTILADHPDLREGSKEFKVVKKKLQNRIAISTNWVTLASKLTFTEFCILPIGISQKVTNTWYDETSVPRSK